jgi:NAD(P)-dependent dehydrogenase (short-subunit alcohol dehydrogenase family)
MRGFDGATVVVTGGSTGIGYATAAAFAAAGASVFIAGRDVARGTAAADALGATYVHADVSDPAQVAELATAAAGTGALDVVQQRGRRGGGCVDRTGP